MNKILFLLIALLFMPTIYASQLFIREVSLLQKDLLPGYINKEFIKLIKNVISDNTNITLSKDYFLKQQRSTQLTKTTILPFITKQTIGMLLKNVLSPLNIATRTVETMNNIQSSLEK